MSCLALLAGLWTAPAFGDDALLLLQWPGTDVSHDDAKLQRAAAKAVNDKELDYRSGDTLFEGNDRRAARLELINELMKMPEACLPKLRILQTQAMARFLEAHGDFWLAVAVDGNVKELVVWRFSDTDGGALTLNSSACQVSPG